MPLKSTVPTTTNMPSMQPTFRRDALALTTLLLITLIWDFLGFDLAVSQVFGNAAGFALKNNALLQFWFHDAAQNIARVGVLGLLIMVFYPMAWFRALSKADRVHAILACVLASLAVVTLKSISQTSCPWYLQPFGGAGQYVSHWALGVVDGGGGRCFPGGHSSSGFAYIALAFWLRPAGLQASRWVFWLAAAAGMVLGWVQLVRGAHFFSHALWAWLVCWAVALLYYHGVQAFRRIKAARSPL